MAASTAGKRDLRLLGIGLALGAATGVGVLLLSKPSALSGAHQQAGQLSLSWGGLKGTVTVADGAELPVATTTLTNGTPQTLTGTVSVATQDGLAFAPVGGDGSFSLVPGASVTLTWEAPWESASGGGPFNLIATVEANGMPTQQFTNPNTFSVAVQTPAGASVQWSGLAGEVTVQQGQDLPDTQTILTNDGETTGTYHLTYASTDGVVQMSVDDRQSLPAGVSVAAFNGINNAEAIVTVDPGQQVSIPWTASWDSPNGGGPFTMVLTVTW